MNWLLKHIPSCVSVETTPQKIPFETTEDLLNLEVVKQNIGAGFSHFAISGDTLMEIYDDGRRWWVTGQIGNPEAVNIPQWDGGK